MSDELAAAPTTHAIIDAARAKLEQGAWDYIAGAAESEATMRRNRLGLDSLALRPRVLRDVSKVDQGGTLLGHPLRIPVVLCPIGALEIFTPDGGVAAARAAEQFGVVAMISTVTQPSLAEVAAATAAPKVAQLYIRGDPAWVDAWLDGVVAAGYVAIAVTVDAAYYGRRDRQLRSGWLPPGHRGGALDRSWQPRLTWEWLVRMRDRAGLPFIVKGIQTAEDAEIAVEHGFEVIHVSNHGGREMDHAEATIETLREVVDAVAGRAQIIVDGGFMRGTDVLKAVALGADAVGIGRLQALALAAGGAPALLRVLELLEEEILSVMGNIGAARMSDLDASFVRRSQPVSSASPLLSAFPADQLDWPPR